MVEALTSRGWPLEEVEEFWGGKKCEELLSAKDLGPVLEPIVDLGSLIELPKEGSGGAGSGGVDGAGGYIPSPSIPVYRVAFVSLEIAKKTKNHKNPLGKATDLTKQIELKGGK